MELTTQAPGLVGARASARGRRWGRLAEADSRRVRSLRAPNRERPRERGHQPGARGPVGPPRRVRLRARVRAPRGRGGRCRGRALAMADLAHSIAACRPRTPGAAWPATSTGTARTRRRDVRRRAAAAGHGVARVSSPELQRASLALCVFGGLTHREAAALLGVPPSTVAELLTAGLRELGRLAAGRTATCA